MRDDLADLELVLVGEQPVVHLPEPTLHRRRLGRLGRQLCLRMHVGERQMTPHVAQISDRRQQLADHRLGLTAIWALEIAVLKQRHLGVDRTADVIALGVDSDRQIDDRLGRADQRAGAHRARQPLGHLLHHAGHQRRADQRRQHAELGLRQLPAPWNASDAISSETVNPIPAIVPPPSTDAHPTGQPEPAAGEPRHERRAAADPDRLADQVGDQDSERDRRPVGVRRGTSR